jgi:hypothetical protein
MSMRASVGQQEIERFLVELGPGNQGDSTSVGAPLLSTVASRIARRLISICRSALIRLTLSAI